MGARKDHLVLSLAHEDTEAGNMNELTSPSPSALGQVESRFLI